MEKTAVVILNWNGADMLRRFLPSVVRHSAADATVYVADNASTDNSCQLLATEFPAVKLIRLTENYGFAEGYNKALQHIEAEYMVLLNSDVEVTRHWLRPLTKFMDSHPEAAVCQPKLLSAADHDSFEYAGASGGFIDRYGYPYCRGRLFDTVERDNGQYDRPCRVLWATGAALMVRSADYRAAGGLDGRFFAHCEEIDLCWRLGILGRQVWCLPESVVYHVGGGTLPKGNPRKTFLNFRNNLTMLYKNLPADELRHVLRVRRWLDWLAAAEMLVLKRNMAECRAVLQGRRAFYHWRRQFDHDRSSIQAQRRSTDDLGRTRLSLLWQYYVRGRRRFSQLKG
ncbi:MAG: glycosyltransferase family 2 protein [Prevotella sp.]|nr:glycosyltransferase family 2 protein [Prevotella sp.]